MKEFALKHPILTFLLADTLITSLFGAISAFAKKKEDIPEQSDEAEEANG